jgi:hydrogenase nickel incorporation protein HypB
MTTEIKIYRDLMGANAEWAEKTRRFLEEKKVRMLNLIGSPGSGKTQLLETTARHFSGGFCVLEGDVETTRDAERLDAAGIPVFQLLSGGSCHLEAKLVHHALRDLPLDDSRRLVIVENVGNLVCPAEFDIGERAKVAVLSVTEGEDKPLKYPLLFREARAAVLTKTDLLPHVPFDLDRCRECIETVHPGLPVFPLSALRETGMEPWIKWLEQA